MIDINDWTDTYQNLSEVGVNSTIETSGLCKKVLGARSLFAEVRITIKPSKELKFTSELESFDAKQAEAEDWLRGIYLGVLDVMLTRPLIPITIFECTINKICFHEIDSSFQAFRVAGRYAAEEFLKQEKFVSI